MACRLDEGEIPEDPLADKGERRRIEEGLAAALGGEFSEAQIARVTGAVTAILMT